jgi:large subunit ribosomal protein L10
MQVFASRCGKDFFVCLPGDEASRTKGGEDQLAITKQRKGELVEEYADWLKRSQAVILVDYRGVLTKDVHRLRTKVREAKGEFHVTKNTLVARALRDAGLPVPEAMLEGPTAMGFCFENPPAVAKVMLDFADESKLMTVKGAVMGNRILDPAGVKALSDLPPRPVVMAQVLGAIQALAGKVAGVLNSAVAQIVRVIQARVDQLKAAEGAA